MRSRIFTLVASVAHGTRGTVRSVRHASNQREQAQGIPRQDRILWQRGHPREVSQTQISCWSTPTLPGLPLISLHAARLSPQIPATHRPRTEARCLGQKQTLAQKKSHLFSLFLQPLAPPIRYPANTFSAALPPYPRLPQPTTNNPSFSIGRSSCRLSVAFSSSQS